MCSSKLAYIKHSGSLFLSSDFCSGASIGATSGLAGGPASEFPSNANEFEELPSNTGRFGEFPSNTKEFGELPSNTRELGE
jgi:hypothetical protein